MVTKIAPLRLGHELRELDFLRAARLARGRIEIWVVGEDAAAEEVHELRGTRADVAEADDAHCPLDELAAHELLLAALHARFQSSMRFRDALQEHQHHPERVLRHALGVSARLVHDRDTGARARVDVDRVVARAGAANEQELGQLLDQRALRVKRCRDLVLGSRDVVAVAVLERRQDPIVRRVGRDALDAQIRRRTHRPVERRMHRPIQISDAKNAQSASLR